MKQICHLLGSLVVTAAITLFAGIVFNPFYLGGQVWGGKLEDGRYYVVAKGHRYTEVTQAQWRVEQYLEAAFPWLPVMLLWIGLGLRVAPDGDQYADPTKTPSSKQALQTLLIVTLIVLGTGAMAVVRCLQCGVPWTLGLGLWLALWIAFAFVLWLQSRGAFWKREIGPATI